MPAQVLIFSQITAALLLVAAGAGAQPTGRTGTAHQELRGGVVITGYPGVVEFSRSRPDLDRDPPAFTGCTASMIAPNVLLTAAHCFESVDGTGAAENSSGSATLRVVYHDPAVGRREVFRGTANWVVPADYAGLGVVGPGDANADIALVVIPGRFTDTDHRDYLRIYDGPAGALERRLRAYGAGAFTYSNRNDKLLRTHWFEVESVARNHLVIDNRDDVNTCAGDSGGPLVFTLTAPGGGIATITGVLSQPEVDREDEGIICANNDPPEDDSFYSRTNWRKFRGLARRAGLRCVRYTGAQHPYRRCFALPFINDIVIEDWPRPRAVAVTAAALF